jgi:hypothetical protein
MEHVEKAERRLEEITAEVGSEPSMNEQKREEGVVSGKLTNKRQASEDNDSTTVAVDATKQVTTGKAVQPSPK